MCGVGLIAGPPQAKQIIESMSNAARHRGDSATGVTVRAEDGALLTAKSPGSIADLVQTADYKELPDSTVAFFHGRYPTQGTFRSSRNRQPVHVSALQGKLVIVSNGDVVDMEGLRQHVLQVGYRIYSENDAELIALTIIHEALRNGWNTVEAIEEAMHRIRGSYSAIMMTEWNEEAFVFRDPWGIRPLYFSEIHTSCGQIFYVAASETAIMDVAVSDINIIQKDAKAKLVGLRKVLPGEILQISPDGVKSSMFSGNCSENLCRMEIYYLMRPDSILDPIPDLDPAVGVNTSIWSIRLRIGEVSYRKHRLCPDVFCPVPRSGRPAAMAYAHAGGIRYDEGVIQNPNLPVGQQGMRDFIQAERGRFLKHTIVPDRIWHKWLGLGDDSLIEGYTSRRLVEMVMNRGGASRIDFFSFAPMVRNICLAGMHFKDEKKLVAGEGRTLAQIRERVGCDVHYPDHEDLCEIPEIGESGCAGCFTGDYPISHN